MFADSHNTLNGWENYFSKLLNIHRIMDVRRMETHTAELLLLLPASSEVGIAAGKFKQF